MGDIGDPAVSFAANARTLLLAVSAVELIDGVVA